MQIHRTPTCIMTFKKQLYSPTSFFNPVPYKSPPLAFTPCTLSNVSPILSASPRVLCAVFKLETGGIFLCASNVS